MAGNTVLKGKNASHVYEEVKVTDGKLETTATISGGGGDGAILDGVSSAIKATVRDYTNSNPVAVTLTDTTGDYVTAGGGTQYTEADTDATITGTVSMGEAPSDTIEALQLDASKNLKISIEADNAGIGGGTQYTEADTDVSITGTAILWEDTSDTLRAVSAAKPLPITITDSTIAVTQSGTWDINDVSGTISLPTGAATEATVASIKTAVEILDNAISGSEMQVDVVTMPTTTVTATDLDIRNLASSSDFVSAVQSGTWNINNISGTISLPTGAATSANQQTDALTDTELRATPVPVDVSDTEFNSVITDVNTGGTQTNDLKVTLDGETVAATQSGTWNIGTVTTITNDVNIADGGNSITVDGTFWQATQPISAAALPLPTGAATSALQQNDALTDTELRAAPVVVDLGANNDVTVTSGTVTTITNDVNIADGGNSITVDGSVTTTSSAVADTPESFEDTSFVTGESPVLLDLNTALGRNATKGYIKNDGAGNFTVSFSTDGAAFGDELTMKKGEVLDFENISVDTIRITWVADSAYRVVVI